MKRSSLCLAILAAGACAPALATPTLGEVLKASDINVTGYVDAAYTAYNTDAPAGINPFDNKEKEFSLKQAALTIASQPKDGAGALVNITTGTDADTISSNGSGAGDNFDVTQAFVQYAKGMVTVQAGKFVTLSGAEVISPTGNSNISRSIAFFNAIAYTHTGVRVAVAPMDGLTVYVGQNNGWDKLDETNKEKTTELGVAYTLNDMLSFTLQHYSGKEALIGGAAADGKTKLTDAVVTFKPISALAIIANYDKGSQDEATGVNTDEATWKALNLYVNYQISDQFRVSLRTEKFKDEDTKKIGSTAEVFKENTLTLGYAPASNIEFRAELRKDKADEKVFDGGKSKSQDYRALEVLYKF